MAAQAAIIAIGRWKIMGMNNKQFNDFIRFILESLNEAKNEEDERKMKDRLEHTIDILQQMLKNWFT